MPQRHLPMQNVIMKQNRSWRSSSWCQLLLFSRCKTTGPPTHAKCNNEAKSFLAVQLVTLTLIFFTIQSCSATYLWYSYHCRKIVLPVRVAILGFIFYFHDAEGHLPMQNVIMKQNRSWRSSSWCSHLFFSRYKAAAPPTYDTHTIAEK